MLRRLRRLAVAAAIAWFAYAVVVALVGLAALPVESDLAVVLGNEVLADGRPSPRLAARLDQAVRLVRSGLAPRVMVSGGVDARGHDEAAAMAAYLVAAGIPATAIVQDPGGFNTAATARNAAAVTGPNTRIVVVTQFFHVPRSLLALRLAGRTHLSASSPAWFEWRDIYSTARETVALPATLLGAL